MSHRACPSYVILALSCLLCAVPTAAGQARDASFTGTWLLNQDKSSFDPPDNRPTNRTVILAITGDALEHTTETLRTVYLDVEPFQEASTTRVSYKARFDGQEHAVPGSMTRVRLKRVGATTFERVATSGRASETSVWALSADGKVLTVTTTGVDATNSPSRSVQVYERE
jgi:hypothetical protein